MKENLVLQSRRNLHNIKQIPVPFASNLTLISDFETGFNLTYSSYHPNPEDWNEFGR